MRIAGLEAGCGVCGRSVAFVLRIAWKGIGFSGIDALGIPTILSVSDCLIELEALLHVAYLSSCTSDHRAGCRYRRDVRPPGIEGSDEDDLACQDAKMQTGRSGQETNHTESSPLASAHLQF